jgi:hypothetical protein
MPLVGLDTLPQPDGPADKPWPASQDIPSGPMPGTDQSAPNPAPRGTEDLATPDLARNTQHRPDPSRRLDDDQPVEKEAALALMGSSPPGQASADRMRSWFGPRGPELLSACDDDPDDQDALAAFRLGILLINNDAPQ